MSTAEQAIEQSVQQTEIVTIEATEASEETLLIACDDHVETHDERGTVEYWGTTDDGDAWRVHTEAR